jgi:hypothetical protein
MSHVADHTLRVPQEACFRMRNYDTLSCGGWRASVDLMGAALCGHTRHYEYTTPTPSGAVCSTAPAPDQSSSLIHVPLLPAVHAFMLNPVIQAEPDPPQLENVQLM